MVRLPFWIIAGFKGIKREEEDDPSYQVQVDPDDSSAPDEVGYDVHFELVKTSRGNDNGLAVYEENGFVRVYRRTSTTGRSASYRCSTCDHLYEKLGQGERPTVKMRDNVIVTDPFPAHNQMCTPTPVDVFRRTQEDLEARQLNMCRRVLTSVSFLLYFKILIADNKSSAFAAIYTYICFIYLFFYLQKETERQKYQD